MKPGGRRAGEVDRHNMDLTTPTQARGRRSLGRQSPPTRGGLDLLGTHTQHSQYASKDKLWPLRRQHFEPRKRRVRGRTFGKTAMD
jgi:hypothetical protein